MPDKKIKLSIKVPFAFDIYFTRNIFSVENPVMPALFPLMDERRKHRVIFVLEKKLKSVYPDLSARILGVCSNLSERLDLVSDPLFLAGGENVKNFANIEKICGIFEKNRLCRHSFVCIVGGGAFLDRVGFSSSIVHRGIRQIRFPTTALSQCDSGVGVKNGINLFGKKNFIGTFSPPFAVVNDSAFLETLDMRDWISGVAEAFKVAMIKDVDFFRWLCANTNKLASRNSQIMELMIRRCAELHIKHIMSSGDPFEFGSARPLDFGHWSAHSLEMLSCGKIRHGEAVAIGIVLDAKYAELCGLTESRHVEKLRSCLEALGFRLWSDLLLKKDLKGRYEVLKGIENFREHIGGELHITLPKGLGNKTEVGEMDEQKIISAIKFLKNKDDLKYKIPS